MQTIWLNLPVKDLEKSKAFFRNIGFRENPRHRNAAHVGSFLIGKDNFCLMLFPEDVFKGFAKSEVSDTNKGSEMLINIDAETREEVDAMAETVKNAGGKIISNPGEAEGWMYAFGFEDPDGHRWCMLHMDMAKMPTN